MHHVPCLQIVNLGRQIFAWVALNDARLDSLAAAFPPASQVRRNWGTVATCDAASRCWQLRPRARA